MKHGAVLRVGAALAAVASALAACSAMIPVNISGDLEEPIATFGVDPAKAREGLSGRPGRA